MDTILTEDRVRAIIATEFADIIKSDRFVFEKLLQIGDGRNFQLGRTNGTKIGTAVDQKVGFYGVAPVAQQTGVASTTAGLYAALQALGFITP